MPAADQFPSGFLVLPRDRGRNAAAIDVTKQLYESAVTSPIMRQVALTDVTQRLAGLLDGTVNADRR